MRNFSRKEMQQIARLWEAGQVVYAHKKTAILFSVPLAAQAAVWPKINELNQGLPAKISEFVVLECDWEVYRAAFDLFHSNWLEEDCAALKKVWERCDPEKEIGVFEEAVAGLGLTKAWYNSKMQTFRYYIDSILRPYNTAYLQLQ